MTQTIEEPQNHGCRFAWCENSSADSESQRLEHFQSGHYVPATAESPIRYGENTAYCETLNTIGIGVRFNEDHDASPMVWVHLHGGPSDTDEDAMLRLDEAVLLHEVLGHAIRLGLQGSPLNEAKIRSQFAIAVTE